MTLTSVCLETSMTDGNEFCELCMSWGIQGTWGLGLYSKRRGRQRVWEGNRRGEGLENGVNSVT